jgi:hypothetical protein
MYKSNVAAIANAIIGSNLTLAQYSLGHTEDTVRRAEGTGACLLGGFDSGTNHPVSIGALLLMILGLEIVTNIVLDSGGH